MQIHMKQSLIQDAPYVDLNPEIVVIAGSSASGLLTEDFPMVYSVTSEKAQSKIADESFITIGIEEPFSTLLVSVCIRIVNLGVQRFAYIFTLLAKSLIIFILGVVFLLVYTVYVCI